MYAVRVHEFGGPDALVYEEIDVPTAGPGQVVVKIEAAGVNFIDVYHRTGLYPNNLPLTLGVEAAGTVAGFGPDVTEFRQGERVTYTGPLGAYAEYAVVPAHRVVHVPDEVSLEQAAAVLLQGMTAQYLTHSTYPIQPGDVILVHAAGGATGQLVAQMAKRRGATIYGTASSEEKAALARAAGVDVVIDYTTQDFAAEIKRLTDGRGVNVVYDSVGKTTFDKSLDCLCLRGTMVLFGQASGAVPPFNPSILNAKGSLFLTRPSLFHYVAERSDLLERANTVFDAIIDGSLKVAIDETFALKDAADAQRKLEGRGATGKLLLKP